MAGKKVTNSPAAPKQGQKLPDVGTTQPLTSQTAPPSYNMSKGPDNAGPLNSANMSINVPIPPKSPQVKSPAPNLNNLDAPLPAKYIEVWKVSEGNLKHSLMEYEFTLRRITSQKIDDLLMKSADFKLDAQHVSLAVFRSRAPNPNHRQTFVKRCLDFGLVDVIKKLWSAATAKFDQKASESGMVDKNITHIWDIFREQQLHIIEAIFNLYKFLLVFWNGSDIRDAQLLSAIHSAGVTDFALSVLNSKYCFPLLNVLEGAQYKMVKSCLGIIHNMVHNFESLVPYIRQQNGLKICSKFISLDSEKLVVIKGKAAMVSAHIITEGEDTSGIALGEKEIKFIMGAIQRALVSKDFYSTTYGYHADELFAGLNRLAVHESNKQKIVDAGALPFYVDALKTKDSKLQACAAQGLWTLAFNKYSKEKILIEPGCMDHLKALREASDKNVQKAVRGALWQLEGEAIHIKTKKLEKTTPDSKKQLTHIMISYQWGVQQEVLQFMQRLRKAGYRIWIDVEQMSGNTLDSMAEAVENAAVVIPVLTEQYKNSPACRQEAAYANQLGKPMMPIRLQPKYKPDGWLGFLLGSTFWYDLTKPDIYESKITEILKALGNSGKIMAGEADLPVSVQPTPPSSLAQPDPKPVIGKATPSLSLPASLNMVKLKCYSWTENEVSTWLKQNSLEAARTHFSGMNGKLLVELACMLIDSPNNFYAFMRDTKMSLMQVLKLNSALRTIIGQHN